MGPPTIHRQSTDNPPTIHRLPTDNPLTPHRQPIDIVCTLTSLLAAMATVALGVTFPSLLASLLGSIWVTFVWFVASPLRLSWVMLTWVRVGFLSYDFCNQVWGRCGSLFCNCLSRFWYHAGCHVFNEWGEGAERPPIDFTLKATSDATLGCGESDQDCSCDAARDVADACKGSDKQLEADFGKTYQGYADGDTCK